MQAKDRIIVAVDVDHPDKAIELVKKLGPVVGSFKIGLELITAMLASILAPLEEQEALSNAKNIREFFPPSWTTVLLGRKVQRHSQHSRCGRQGSRPHNQGGHV